MKWLGPPPNFFQDFRERSFFTFGEGIRGVAIRAAQIAGGEPDENARQPGKGAFALQAQINFVDDERVGHTGSVAGRRQKGMCTFDFQAG